MKELNIFKEIIYLILLALLQAVICSRISFLGYATPIIYVYFLIKLPLGRSPYYVIILGFLLGLIIDIFLNTPGMNAAATTITATCRQSILSSFYEKKTPEYVVPSLYSSKKIFFQYVAIVLAIQTVLLFLIESFTIYNLTAVATRIGASFIVSYIIIIALDGIVSKREKKSAQQ